MKKLLSLVLIASMLLGLFPTFAIAENAGYKLVLYPEYPSELARDYDYEVTLTQNGNTVSIPVYNPSRLKGSFNANKGTDSWRRFCEFSFEGEVTVSVKTKLKVDSYSVLPSSKGILSTFENGTITFTLTKPENIVIRLNDDQNTNLCIFAEDLMEDFDYQAEIDAGRNVIYFDAGFNNLNNEKTTVNFNVSPYGQIRVPKNTTLYLAPGALVPNRLILKDDGAKVLGRGALIDPRTDRATSGESHMLLLTRNEGGGVVYDDFINNVEINGIRILDAYCFNVDISYAKNTTLSNLKVLSSEISTDGVTVRNDCSNITVDNCFFYVNDNNMVVTNSNENIVFKNLIFGSNHAVFYPQGTTTSFTAENINVFRMGNFIKAAENSGVGGNWNITGKNIHCADALTMANLIHIQNQGYECNATATFENVSLPETNMNVNVHYSKGFTFNLNNVYFGSTPFNSTDCFTITQTKKDSVTFNFGAEFNPALAGVGINKTSANFQGNAQIKIGGYAVDFDKNEIKEINSKTFFPANNLLKALGYTATQTGETLKISTPEGEIKIDSAEMNVFGLSASSNGYAVFENGAFLLSENFFEEVLNLEVDGNTFEKIKGKNLISDPSFENITNTLIPDNTNNFASSNVWTHYAFGGLYEYKADSRLGNTSLKLVLDTRKDNGLAQYLTPEIRKNGSGVYHIECYAKVLDSNLSTGDLETDSVNVNMGVVEAGYQITNNDGENIGINDFKNFMLTNTWQKLSYDVVITDIENDGYTRAFFYLGGAGDEKCAILVDDVCIEFYETVNTTAELNTLLNEKAPTRENALFVGWCDQNGKVYTTQTAVSSAVNLLPKFINVNSLLTEKVEQKKTVLVGEILRTPNECRLGVHTKTASQTVYNVFDSGASLSNEGNLNLKNGKIVIPYSASYFSQARFWNGSAHEEGQYFESFYAAPAPENHTPKTIAMVYDEENHIFKIPVGEKVYAGDTILFDVCKELTDSNPVSTRANYINGIYVQGAQARVGNDTTTGLRFIIANNVKLLEVMNSQLSNVSFGTLLTARANTQASPISFSTPRVVDSKGENIYVSAASLGRWYQKYTACVINIPSKNVKSDIAVRPYIKYTDLSGIERVLYGEQYATNIYDVAEFAYNNPNEDDYMRTLLFNEILSKAGVDNDLNIDF